MPRSLSRLRYRSKFTPPPIASSSPISRRQGPYVPRPVLEARLERRAAAYVVRQSKPGSLKLQTVVNPKAKPRATGQVVPPLLKPFTVRDVVDPERKARHGEIVYVFRNIKTNQIIYSLQELLDNHHLEQLPFIGKHSKPPVLRPDEWLPHCVVTFPTPEQGHNAFRKMREFRTLHELAWDKTNPEFKQLDRKQRIKKIMDQRANMSADLAEVLRIQEAHGVEMTKKSENREQKATEYLKKRWQDIHALANAAIAKKKEADNVKWLEHQIRSMSFKLKMKHNQKEGDQKRLQAAKKSLETRLGRVQYAQRKVEQLKNSQGDLAPNVAPANEAGVEAETQAEARDHYITRSVLQRRFNKAPPTPYTLEGVTVQWADLQDALYAKGRWPEVIEHENLVLNRARGEIQLLSAEDYGIETRNSVSRVLQALREKEEEKRMETIQERRTEKESKHKTGVPKFLPDMRNLFKSATV